MPSSSCQPPSDSGAATPMPCSAFAQRRLELPCAAAAAACRSRRTACRGRGRRSPATGARAPAPVKSTSSMSMLRRPILMPMEKAPSGLSAIGTEGWPTLPRTRRALAHQPVGFEQRAMMIDTVCARQAASGARSRPSGSAPCRRIACSTTRSLNWRMPPWLEPRGRSRRFGASGSAPSAALDCVGLGHRTARTRLNAPGIRRGSVGAACAPVITATVSLMLIFFGFSTRGALAQPRDVDAVGDLEHVRHVVGDQHHRQARGRARAGSARAPCCPP